MKLARAFGTRKLGPGAPLSLAQPNMSFGALIVMIGSALRASLRFFTGNARAFGTRIPGARRSATHSYLIDVYRRKQKQHLFYLLIAFSVCLILSLGEKFGPSGLTGLFC